MTRDKYSSASTTDVTLVIKQKMFQNNTADLLPPFTKIWDKSQTLKKENSIK